MFIHLVFRLKFELVKSVLARRTRGTFSSSLVLILEGLVLRSKPMLLMNWQQVGSPSNPEGRDRQYCLVCLGGLLKVIGKQKVRLRQAHRER